VFCLRSLVALAVLHRLQTLLPAGARSEVEKWYSLEMHDPIQDVTPGRSATRVFHDAFLSAKYSVLMTACYLLQSSVYLL
jgi:hypothetical protein